MRVLVFLVVLAIAFLIWRVGMSILRALATPLPGPPPAGELRKVKLLYQCPVCYSEVRMTAATHEDPEAPRHCQAEMDLITPVE